LPPPLLQRPWFVWVWGGVIVALTSYMSVFYYQYVKLFLPLLSGSQVSSPGWLENERAFMLVCGATAIAAVLSFGLFGLTVLHAWRYTQLSQTGKIVWILVPVFLWQPGFLAYWVWNVARPLIKNRQLGAV